ncbi:hypothetical protein GEMRC1_000304 [Eukaryota sp. GEM-RC1]
MSIPIFDKLLDEFRSVTNKTGDVFKIVYDRNGGASWFVGLPDIEGVDRTTAPIQVYFQYVINQHLIPALESNDVESFPGAVYLLHFLANSNSELAKNSEKNITGHVMGKVGGEYDKQTVKERRSDTYYTSE